MLVHAWTYKNSLVRPVIRDNLAHASVVSPRLPCALHGLGAAHAHQRVDQGCSRNDPANRLKAVWIDRGWIRIVLAALAQYGGCAPQTALSRLMTLDAPVSEPGLHNDHQQWQGRKWTVETI